MSALSTPIRLRILDLLSCGELCASAIQEHFSISQSALSYHMKILSSSGVIAVRNERKYVFYSLDMGSIRKYLEKIEYMIAPKEDCACHAALQHNCK